MELKNKQKIKLILIFAVEFISVLVILLLIFFAGKKSYTVTFDLNGGILLSGDTEQRVTQGHHATPPSVAKDGHYLRGWAGNYRTVTSDSTVRAIWEYVTSPGIIYSDDELKNYTEIVGSHPEINGVVYVGAYYNEKITLTIRENAFRDRRGITEMHLLEGILSIEEGAFAGCESMETIDIPSTVKRIGKDAFAGCKSLKTIILPEGLTTIEDGAFAGCESLTEVIIPSSVTRIGSGAFDTEGLTLLFLPEISEDENAPEPDYDAEVILPEGFAEDWITDGVTVKYKEPEEDEEAADEKGDKDTDKKN